MTSKKSTKKAGKKRRGFIETDKFARIYLVFGVSFLIGTTVLWSLYGAMLATGNADQLSNVFLMKDAGTFHNASLPGQHSFLFKWPLFWLIGLTGSSVTTFVVATVATVVATVSLLAWIIYRIERRPIVFSTICLALSSVLLLVPAQPYPGGLLPVNMAMLTTRNLEYILYIVALWLFARSKKVRSIHFATAVGVMSILIASDKLFLTLGAGAAALSLLIYSIIWQPRLAREAARWLFGQLIAGGMAIVILSLINTSRLTHIIGGSSASPYRLVNSLHEVFLGMVYAVLGLMSNLGLNPGFDVRVLASLPHQLVKYVTSWGVLALTVNIVVSLLGLFAIGFLIKASVFNKKAVEDIPERLSIMLIWTTVVAVGIFALSNHYYTVDARYLTVSLFTLFICLATLARKTKWSSKSLVMIGSIIAFCALLGIPSATSTYNSERKGLYVVNQRNEMIAKVLAQHKVDVLVGDYWRVLPSRILSKNTLNVMPTANCTQARDGLSSKTWQPNLRTHSFAYLISFDQKLTDYPSCTIDQVISVYGQPNTSTLLAGTHVQPKELLLFYDHGISKEKHSTATQVRQQAPTSSPISLDQLSGTSCSVPSALNIVAHQDDDLLFMNPDIAHEIKAGHCVRTVYVTAGDSGGGAFYWLSRQQSSQAAYSKMLGVANVWTQRIVKLDSGQYITVASPSNNARVSLIFMNLPDGNLRGEGFHSTKNKSLESLKSFLISSIQSVDSQSTYTKVQLTDALTSIMYVYHPTEIRTQSSFTSATYPDHSDHIATGRFVTDAYEQYEAKQFEWQTIIPIHHYIGYPIRGMEKNIVGADLEDKTAIFRAYAAFDGAVCDPGHSYLCKLSKVYREYLPRQYTALE